MPTLLEAFCSLLNTGDLTVVEQIELPPREERKHSIPSALQTGAVGRWLTQSPLLKGKLWQHQSLALEAVLADQNVVMSTGTASGKSLVFQAAALRTMEVYPESRVIVFYPLKALSADQLVSWKKILDATGLPETAVMKVDGDVLPDKRREALDKARILLMTPDVCHAWLMRNVSDSTIRRFLAHTELVVIDEAHVLEAVFGSNFAFLFRRLQTARNLSCGAKDDIHSLRVIAASATIANPAAHLKALTGLEFISIGEENDGSPRQPLSLFHLAGNNSTEQTFIAQVQRSLLEQSSEGSFITFVDSRQGVERLAIQTDLEELVRPYRSGYEAADRENIENTLRHGTLRGVVSTSALELGIDIPHFSVGFNLGIPNSRKAFRQRLGRIGRNQPGAFAMIAEPSAFMRYGSTFADYYAGSIEPSHLYLNNRFMQFAHARCLSEELDMLGVIGRKVPPRNVEWPKGFDDIFEFAHIGGTRARPKEFDHIAQIGGDAPHLNYPLRNVAETSFVVLYRYGAMSQRVGTLTLHQAIREAYPGALYLHLAQGWRVREWRSSTFDRAIRVSRSPSRAFTRPLIRTFVNLSVEPEGLIEGHFRKGAHGFLAECQLQIIERVEGYEERGDRKLYRDLRQSDPAMTPKTRDFRTTGVVLKIETEWMKVKGVKQQIAEGLRDLLIREYSISTQDVGGTATNIAIVQARRLSPVSDAIVIYDATLGSLRLTEPTYKELDQLISRLVRATKLISADALLPADVVANLKTWYEELGPDSPQGFFELATNPNLVAPEGWLAVYAPESIVGVRDVQGVMRDVEVIEPVFVTIEGTQQLFYRYKTNNAVNAMVAANKVERIGDEWRMVFWNVKTGEFKDELEEES